MKFSKKGIVFSIFIAFIFFASAQSYQNPVIPGFYPDPSICRAGDDYFLVNSSFEYFPGIPIWTSKDLIHWKQIGNVLNRASQLPLTNTKPSNGIYAPTIRFHQGEFYIVVTNVSGNKGYHNFYVHSTNPAGPWSEPVPYEQNGIDPSLFFDEDGKTYFISNRGTQSTDERAIYQSEIDLKTGKRISAIQQIWKGSGGSYVEGPHMYKKDGYYYLLTAEGGTSYGHTVAIGRSRTIWGPYESCPYNPILTNRMSYSVIQGTGHADLVQAPDSSWWMVHLAFRPAIDGIHFIGRETCLAPVEWKKDEWPRVNKNGQEEAIIHQLPPNYQSDQPVPFQNAVVTHFTEMPGLEWIYLRNPDSANYSIQSRHGWLRLQGNVYSLFDQASPAFLARRQQHFNFSASTLLSFDPLKANEEAGLTVMMDNRFHYDFYVQRKGETRILCLRYTLDSLQQIVSQTVLKAGDVVLKVSGDKRNYTFSYKQKEEKFQQAGILNTRFLGTEVSGGYNGVVLGIYATGNGENARCPADFNWFEYEPLFIKDKSPR